MKALNEIGMRRALRFALGEILDVLLAVCWLPQLRSAVLRLFGARLGRDTIIHRIRLLNWDRGSLRNLTMGPCCYIGPDCLLDLAAPIRCGAHVTLAPRVTVLTHANVGYRDHPLQTAFPSRTAGVTIGDGVFVGACSTLLCGVVLGPRCCIAAGSVVTQSVEAETLVGGVPAAPLRRIVLSPETLNATPRPGLGEGTAQPSEPGSMRTSP